LYVERLRCCRLEYQFNITELIWNNLAASC